MEKSNNHFGIAIIITLIMIMACSVFILLYGKEESFILINGNHNSYSDFFFKYMTYAGDGWMWLAVLLFSVLFKKKYIPAVLAAIIISTLLSQFLKRVIFPEDLRPITFLSDQFPIHMVEGIRMNRLYSFPSGHTVSAFTIALLVAHMINKRFWSIVLPLIAMLVGYSRVYLAQHFLTDVLAGICIGFLSSLLSLMIYRAFIRYLKRKTLLR